MKMRYLLLSQFQGRDIRSAICSRLPADAVDQYGCDPAEVISPSVWTKFGLISLHHDAKIPHPMRRHGDGNALGPSLQRKNFWTPNPWDDVDGGSEDEHVEEEEGDGRRGGLRFAE
jgi:hypothetical protein